MVMGHCITLCLGSVMAAIGTNRWSRLLGTII